jgi:hypothetical protein|tara:strand:- start:217 stop:786 length:570 start_codon:yes stop_codon:yes gene_type:complete
MKPLKPEEFSMMVNPYYTMFIKYKGVWDMQDLYESMADFFRNQKFKFYETINWHKSPSPFGARRRYEWEAIKNVEEYYRFELDIRFETHDVHDVEIKTKDGSKKTFTKGRIWVQIRGRVLTDYGKNWEDSSFYAQLRNFYHKYVIQKKIEGDWQDTIYYNVMNPLHNLIQQRLKMETEEYEHREFTGAR